MLRHLLRLSYSSYKVVRKLTNRNQLFSLRAKNNRLWSVRFSYYCRRTFITLPQLRISFNFTSKRTLFILFFFPFESARRYIEGLNVENRYISNWDKQMNANPDNTQIPDVTKLPAEWLGNGVGNHGNVVNALWTLRNMMMRDVLAINKTL